ncbi:MAG: ATP-dependent sacrificial sulfur transferase LarE [Chitinivibrionales bacterium]|nr:ATP-dependent sacrificial sulfur transferase LarE [Chitinivibrionales bacterium]
MDKLKQLEEFIADFPSALVAFSGGVDSTFLGYMAGKVLKGKVLLVTARSSTYPESEFTEAVAIASQLELPHRSIVSEELDIPGFINNPPDRCYFCKRELFSKLRAIAAEGNYAVVFDGTNADDSADYRPGRKALAELEIISPLLAVGLTKADIRSFSQQFGLKTAQKPAYACLASRFPYGETITKDKLSRVGQTEAALRKLGFSQFRVRSHNDLARIELLPAEMEQGWKSREQILTACKSAGFTFVALDLQGYRTGAMNESLKK